MQHITYWQVSQTTKSFPMVGKLFQRGHIKVAYLCGF